MANKNLTLAKRAKNDEFYTQISDIEKELKHYRNHFKDAVVFCNCDVNIIIFAVNTGSEIISHHL